MKKNIPVLNVLMDNYGYYVLASSGVDHEFDG